MPTISQCSHNIHGALYPNPHLSHQENSSICAQHTYATVLSPAYASTPQTVHVHMLGTSNTFKLQKQACRRSVERPAWPAQQGSGLLYFHEGGVLAERNRHSCTPSIGCRRQYGTQPVRRHATPTQSSAPHSQTDQKHPHKHAVHDRSWHHNAGSKANTLLTHPRKPPGLCYGRPGSGCTGIRCRNSALSTACRS